LGIAQKQAYTTAQFCAGLCEATWCSRSRVWALHRSKRMQQLISVQDYVKQHGALGAVFGHSGMVASAEAILKDMEDHGVLQTLLHGEEYQNQE